MIANKLLPVAGVLQYGDSAKKGALNSEELIYTDVIQGMLNIGVADANGQYGATGFVTRLLTMVSAPPIKSEGIIRTVYNVLADLVNVVFGGRYGTARNVVPLLRPTIIPSTICCRRIPLPVLPATAVTAYWVPWYTMCMKPPAV